MSNLTELETQRNKLEQQLEKVRKEIRDIRIAKEEKESQARIKPVHDLAHALENHPYLDVTIDEYGTSVYLKVRNLLPSEYAYMSSNCCIVDTTGRETQINKSVIQSLELYKNLPFNIFENLKKVIASFYGVNKTHYYYNTMRVTDNSLSIEFDNPEAGRAVLAVSESDIQLDIESYRELSNFRATISETFKHTLYFENPEEFNDDVNVIVKTSAKLDINQLDRVQETLKQIFREQEGILTSY